MKKILVGVAFFAIAAGVVSAQALDLKGSDTLRKVTQRVIAACGTPGLVYKGGGSGAGEGALIANFPATGLPAGADWTKQQLAPMSRALAGAAPTGGVCAAGDLSQAEQIEVGGDDIAVLMAETHQAACDLGSLIDNCQGYGPFVDAATPGQGISFHKTLSTGVTISGWKDVLRLIYFGLAPNDFPAPGAFGADFNFEVTPANIAKRDCRDPSRDELRRNWGKLFQNECDGGGCTQLRHAFRHDENSGTTDFFRETLGLEGGASFGNKGFPFCNEFIPFVTLNAATATTIANNQCTSSAQCAAGFACDRGQMQCAKSCTVATQATDCAGLAGSVCVNSFCAKAVDGCLVDADCRASDANGPYVCDKNVSGGVNAIKGGTCVPQCTPGAAGDTACSAYLPAATCAAIPALNGDPAHNGCTRAFGTICPSPGVVTNVGTGTSPTFVGTVAGVAGPARTTNGFGAVGLENDQDNDLLRAPTAGNFTISPSGNLGTGPAEQVSSFCGDLGLVLPISEPPADATVVVDPNVFPTAPCGFGKYGFAPGTKLQGGLDPRYSLCPNGDMPNGGVWDAVSQTVRGGTGACLYPRLAAVATFQCLNAKNNNSTGFFNPSPLTFPVPAARDGRVYNLHLFPATGLLHTTQPYTWNASAGPHVAPVGETESILAESVTHAYYRIHTTRTLKAAPDAVCTGPSGTCCAQSSNTTQIGCLVAASPCSMGYAGRGALDATPVSTASGSFTSFAAGLSKGTCTGTTTVCGSNTDCAAPATCDSAVNVSPNGPNGCILNGPAPVKQYPIARDLFVSSLVGVETARGDQAAFLECYTTPALVNPILTSNGFVPLPAYPCCRDFNEQTACGAAVNVDACANNAAPLNTICTF